VPETTVAIVGEPLVQVPPVVASFRVIVCPTQTVFGPVIGESGLILMLAVEVHPVGRIYEMVAEPGATPVTTPEVELMVAIPVALLLQVP
jgi:hypothetical protein